MKRTADGRVYWQRMKGVLYAYRIDRDGSIKIGFTSRSPKHRMRDERSVTGPATLLVSLEKSSFRKEQRVHGELRHRARRVLGVRSEVYWPCAFLFAVMTEQLGCRFRVTDDGRSAMHHIEYPNRDMRAEDIQAPAESQQGDPS